MVADSRWTYTAKNGCFMEEDVLDGLNWIKRVTHAYRTTRYDRLTTPTQPLAKQVASYVLLKTFSLYFSVWEKVKGGKEYVTDTVILLRMILLYMPLLSYVWVSIKYSDCKCDLWYNLLREVSSPNYIPWFALSSKKGAIIKLPSIFPPIFHKESQVIRSK